MIHSPTPVKTSATCKWDGNRVVLLNRIVVDDFHSNSGPRVFLFDDFVSKDNMISFTLPRRYIFSNLELQFYWYLLPFPYGPRNLHVCTCVCAQVPEHISTLVSSCIWMCKWLLFFMCVSNGLRPVRLTLGSDPGEPVACAACQTGIVETGATHNAVAAALHAAAGACSVHG